MCVFAAAATRQISLKANFEEVVLFSAEDAKVLSLCGSHCSRLSA